MVFARHLSLPRHRGFPPPPAARRCWRGILALAGCVALCGWAAVAPAGSLELVSAADGTTQEFLQAYNREFTAYWQGKTGNSLSIQLPRTAGGSQAAALAAGVDGADVVAWDRAADIETLHAAGRLLPANWAGRLPNQSVPFVSTILFLVRPGNPKDLRNWSDLVRTNISVVVASPKTSSAGQYAYLAAWGYALKQSAGDEKQARDFVAKLFARVPVLDVDGPGAIQTFARHGIGDVLLAPENVAAWVQSAFPTNHLQAVLPHVSILAEHPVAWVDASARRHHRQALAQAYVEYLYSDAAQELAAQHFFRPKNPAILARYATRYRPVELLTVSEVAGGWEKAQQVHFADGGIFDQIHPRRKPE